jgi:purine nucleosidase
MRRILSIVLVVLTPIVSTHAAPVRDVIIDHDGGVDDLIAVALLMKSPDIRVRAVTITPGDCYVDPAARATELILDKFGGRDITIAKGHNEGTNPFPAEWRNDAARVLSLPVLANARPSGANRAVAETAPRHLVRLLSGDRAYTILETGPLTNIADALTIEPSIRRNITRIYVMGGAVRAKGNVVDQRGHDGTAEWNFYNQPQAAAAVVRSGIPITLIPLDATNKVPLTPVFVDRLAKQPSVASQLAAQSWKVATLDPANPYYFWDTLTAAALVNPELLKTEPLRIRIITSGASQGRAVVDPQGTRVDVALDASQRRVEQMFLDVLGC